MPTRGKTPPDKSQPGSQASRNPQPPASEKAHLMTESEIERTLVHLAHDIVEKTEEKLDLAIVGVRRRGELLGARLGAKIRQMTKVDVPVGSLDVELYRDDRPATAHPQQPSQIPFSITGKDVILVDDVLFTGRTTRAALEAIFDHGRPKRDLPDVERPKVGDAPEIDDGE